MEKHRGKCNKLNEESLLFDCLDRALGSWKQLIIQGKSDVQQILSRHSSVQSSSIN